MVSRETPNQDTPVQPLTERTSQVEAFKAALRMQETGSFEGNYVAQGTWNSRLRDRSFGAYGIMSKNWRNYAAAAGIPNANWRDPSTQDRVASQAVENLADRYGGNWGLVAVAWFAGAAVADAVVARHSEEASLDQIRSVTGTVVGDYAQQLVDSGASIADSVWGQENATPNLTGDVGFVTASNRVTAGTSQNAQDIIRRRLVTLAGISDVEEPVEPGQPVEPVEPVTEGTV